MMRNFIEMSIKFTFFWIIFLIRFLNDFIFLTFDDIFWRWNDSFTRNRFLKRFDSWIWDIFTFNNLLWFVVFIAVTKSWSRLFVSKKLICTRETMFSICTMLTKSFSNIWLDLSTTFVLKKSCKFFSFCFEVLIELMLLEIERILSFLIFFMNFEVHSFIFKIIVFCNFRVFDKSSALRASIS